MKKQPLDRILIAVVFCLGIIAFVSCEQDEKMPEAEIGTSDRLDNLVNWGIYRGDKKANQYSELAYIHAANVHRLKEVWTYNTGDATKRSSMQCNPIVVDGLMYLSTFSLNAIALDAVTGEEKWVFKSSEHNEGKADLKGRSRGVTYWEGEEGKRIFHFVRNRVYALDANTGKLIKSFGNGGHIDLRNNLDMDPALASVEVTSPGIVFENNLIVSSRVSEGYNSTPGHVRAFDAVTGAFRWIFHTIPKEGEFGYDTWEWVDGVTYGGANAWGGLSLDEERGWVFCATGSPAPDFYGANRKGMNLFGNCVLALDAKTGKRKWHYQTVHHDLWDYDNPSAPILVTIKDREGEKDAVVQLTKMGLTFVLDRETGVPLFPVEEVPVPKSTVVGEEAWPTQPIPSRPPPLNRLQLTEADLSRVTDESYEQVRKTFSEYHAGPIYTPPSTIGEIAAPGFFGGVEWHGGSFDAGSNILYVNSHDAPTLNRLKRIYDLENEDELTSVQLGQLIFNNNCTACHGMDREGIAPLYPPVIHLEKSRKELTEIIRSGRGVMPSFSQLNSKQIEALVSYLMTDVVDTTTVGSAEGAVRYTMEGYRALKDPYGAPGISPPWGTLNAIDLKNGTIKWKVPLGEYPALAAKGIKNTGSMNYGGCVATAGGIVFVAATYDEKIRAFEKISGKLLWEHQLPAGGYATPSVYAIDGKQYVTIVAGGGGKNGTKSGDAIITFALGEHDDLISTKHGADSSKWISLFDGESLDGWAELNGCHMYTVRDNAIVGTTVDGSDNSFLCSFLEFDDFDLEVEVMVDDVTNSGVQFRSNARPVTIKKGSQYIAGRVYGPQAEIRRNFGTKGAITTGLFYGEALGTGWLSPKEKMDNYHDHFLPEAWNLLRIKAVGPRMQTWVNGHLIDDVTREDVYETHPKGFIGLQVHGISNDGPFEMKWRNIRIRPL